MLIFAADKFVKARESLRWLEQMLKHVQDPTKQVLVSRDSFRQDDLSFLLHLDDLSRQVTELGLNVSAKGIAELKEVMTTGKPISIVNECLSHVTKSVHAELEATCFLHVPPGKCSYFEAKELFGPEVARAFSSASVDIEEAGKCFALERYTACLFHLMRVMEIGLRVFAESLDDPKFDPKKHPSWIEILKRCDGELKKPRNERAHKWQTDERFFSDATAKLWAVKDAWRNPTMHVEITYTEEQALDVFNAVKGFVRTLATKLSDTSTVDTSHKC